MKEVKVRITEKLFYPSIDRTGFERINLTPRAVLLYVIYKLLQIFALFCFLGGGETGKTVLLATVFDPITQACFARIFLAVS